MVTFSNEFEIVRTLEHYNLAPTTADTEIAIKLRGASGKRQPTIGTGVIEFVAWQVLPKLLMPPVGGWVVQRIEQDIDVRRNDADDYLLEVALGLGAPLITHEKLKKKGSLLKKARAAGLLAMSAEDFLASRNAKVSALLGEYLTALMRLQLPCDPEVFQNYCKLLLAD